MKPLPFVLPKAIADVAAGRAWRQEHLGKSKADVVRFDGGLYLKSLRRDPRDPRFGALSAERDKLIWLAGRLPVPTVIAFASDDERDHLLMTEVVGANAATGAGPDDRPWLVRALADACRLVHSVAIDGCPFDVTTEQLLAEARARLEQGLVDGSDFDASRKGRSVHELYDELRSLTPPSAELVFTHGDLCLPNVIMRDGRLGGLVDLGGAGSGDRWRDLALCFRSTCANYGPEWGEAFLSACGVEPNRRRIDFHLLLDEFF